ncbi:MAG: prepilin-type N-terminal cleavage/methylation domain-containing protein [Candidatus Latescibacteria bacterium]|nr:prepilin-type N-terminal cleavage/methylation domain-containing protein [Candidatus Latescibacterota bacterium]
MKIYYMKKEHGVTIVELLVVIFIIGMFIAFFTPTVLNRASTNARISATRQQLNEIRAAIVGDPNLVSGGEYVATGFKNDIGRPPRHLIELVRRVPDTLGLDSMSIWNPFTKLGWNGPYLRDDGKYGFLYDAWGDLYEFLFDSDSNAIGIKSRGPDGEWFGPGLRDDDIIVQF